MRALFVDRDFSRTHSIEGFRARHRAQFDCEAWIMVGDYAADFSVHAHYHPDLMIDTVIGGRGTYHWTNDRTRCEPGTLIVVRPGQVHDVRPDVSGMTIVSLGPSAAWLCEAGVPAAPLRESRTHPRAALQIFRLVHELRSSDAASALITQELALHALLELFGSDGRIGHARVPPIWMKRVIARLHDDPSAPASLRLLAKEVGVHFTHLARLFRAHQGCTIGEYHRMLRVQGSMKRLVDSRAPLAMIALEAGFCDQSHFHRCFRRCVGVSPGAFRRIFRPI